MSRVKRISFVGAGALANGLAKLLRAQEYEIDEIIARRVAGSQRRAAALARKVQATATTLENARLDCDLLWLAVPDGAIEQVSRELAEKIALLSQSPRRKALKTNQRPHTSKRSLYGAPAIILHASGALSSHALADLTSVGVQTGSAHPMMTFVAGEPPSLEGAWFAVEGTPAAVRAAKAIAKDLGANSFRIDPGRKTLYHAFGAMLSPMLATELEAAERVGLRAGIDARQVRRIMEPIVLRTVGNVLRNGAGKSFSGPLARGDVRTVEGHLEALSNEPEGRVYRALVEYACGTLPVKRVEEMKKLLRRR